MQHFAVLTGDIVDSSALSAAALDDVVMTIHAASHEIATWSAAKAPVFFARRGGDSWQIALADPHQTLRAALYIQARIKALDTPAATRIAIATGDGTVPPSGDLNAAHGAAFTASGRTLAALSGPATMAHAEGGAAHAATRLADHIAQGWTQAQARTAALALAPQPPTQAAIAEMLGITRQAVSQAVHSAGLPDLRAALEAMERTEDGK